MPTIQSVNNVDITELPKDTQTQVNQVIAASMNTDGALTLITKKAS